MPFTWFALGRFSPISSSLRRSQRYGVAPSSLLDLGKNRREVEPGNGIKATLGRL